MSTIFYFLIILLVIVFGTVSYFAGFVYGKSSEGKPVEIKPIIKKKKIPDSKAAEQLKEYQRQLYNIEHYTGSSDGMKRKGGDR